MPRHAATAFWQRALGHSQEPVPLLVQQEFSSSFRHIEQPVSTFCSQKTARCIADSFEVVLANASWLQRPGAMQIQCGCTRAVLEKHAAFARLSGHERKFSDVCGEEFSAQARRERRAYPASGSVRSEQRSLGRKEPPPGGLRRIWPGASLLVGHSPTSGGCSLLAPRPRPNWAQQTSSNLRS